MSEVSMESRIHAHIDTLFAGAAPDARVSEVKMELYMNTVDRYHDLLAEGKTPEDAFRGATERIGDVQEILASIGLPVVPQKQEKSEQKKNTPKGKTRKKILRNQGCHIITMLMLCLYFILSFATSAWHITWLIFPIVAAITGLVNACLDMKEDK